jgi:hypothetical protein
MKTAAIIAQILVRLAGVIQIVLGVLFWTNNALTLVPIHMLVGFALVILLWALAGMALWAGVNWSFAALALVWGVVVVVLGMTQTRLLPGSAHWVIQVLHLLVGLGAIGQAEGLASRIKRAQTPILQP